ncbi:hypothetical protein GGU11DRAFT_469590 [Lentinula aff. detonsa]|nr:hypothetical protein GGU11DRAFT_469590 [Lentinula aff. detonsa]
MNLQTVLLILVHAMTVLYAAPLDHNVINPRGNRVMYMLTLASLSTSSKQYLVHRCQGLSTLSSCLCNLWAVPADTSIQQEEGITDQWSTSTENTKNKSHLSNRIMRVILIHNAFRH